MKTVDQIIRYIYQCEFSDEDWQRVSAYCREQFKMGRVRKSMSPISKSTYDQFLDWIDSGFGSGDLVSYGKTMGVISDYTPEEAALSAYCDFEGNLIIKRLDIQNVSRLKRLDEERSQELKKKIYKKGFDIYQRSGGLVELYTPKENFYVTLGDRENDDFGIGIYLESNGCSHHFSAFLDKDNKLEMDCWVDIGCTPFRPATEKDIQILHQATSNAGWYYNGKTNTFIRRPKRGHNNVYWYMNDRFEIVLDRDNGSSRHTERYEAGNYFIDNTEALLFMKRVRDMRSGGD